MFALTQPRARHWVAVLPIVCALGVFVLVVRAAWMSDDAFITLRSVDNLVHGYGPRWNVAERVQAFTHPLWMLLLSAAYFVTREPFFTPLVISLLLTASTLGALVFAGRDRPWGCVLALAILACSRGFVDYSTSGLENPLTHLLWVVSILKFAQPGVSSQQRLTWCAWCAGLAAFNRLDTLLLHGLVLASCAVLALRTAGVRSVLRPLAWSFAPLLLWEIFSIIYYGAPLPNTYYAKLDTGAPADVLWDKGLYYLGDFARSDPLGAAAAVGAVALPLLFGPRRLAVVGLAGVAYGLYVVRIGGDFMSCRLFSVVVLGACTVLACLPWLRGALGGGVGVLAIALALLSPLSRLGDGGDYHRSPERKRTAGGVTDERAHYFGYLGMLRVLSGTNYRRHPYAREARRDAAGAESIEGPVKRYTIGLYGYFAGPTVHIIDTLALADPLLARIPLPDPLHFRIGHCSRPVPPGYAESLREGGNHIRDPDLAEVYDAVRLTVTGDLWTGERWQAVWRLATGGYEAQVQRFMERQRTPSDTGAPRKKTHAGSAGWAEGTGGFYARARGARTDAERAATTELERIGYAGGYEEAPDESGVTVHDRRRAHPGLNLLCSGHAPEAQLVDMDGTVLHTWRLPYESIPEAPEPPDPKLSAAWRRVALLQDGGLLAIHEGLLLVAIDRDSRLLWTFAGKPHHDLEVQSDGTVYVLTRRSVFREDLHAEQPVLEDFVSVLGPDGVELRRVSLVDAFLNSEYRGLVIERQRPAGDIFHTNTIEVLDGRLANQVPAFQAGHVLVSVRHLDTIAVVDLDEPRVTWAAQGPWITQHQPTVLDSGNLLLFDNRGHEGASQVLEIDPATLETRWAYRGTPPRSFLTVLCGSNQRLPNGNTLITETCNGRAFEVTAAGETVWEYVSPHRAGEQEELVAALFEVIRVDPDSCGWLD